MPVGGREPRRACAGSGRIPVERPPAPPAAEEGELAVELHERIAASPAAAADAASNGNGSDPFAELKNRIHLALVSELGPRLFDVEDDGAVRSRVESEIRDQLAQESGLSRDDRQRLAAEIADDIFGYGPLERLLADPSVSEIMVNGPKDIWIEREGRLSETPLTFTDSSHLRRIITKMVGQVGRRIDESSPLVDARLPDGSRVNAIIPPLSLSGPLLTIRKFAQNRFAFSELIEIGTVAQEAAEFLQKCIHAQLNILVSGGTGTGKTTFLNALSASIPASDRIVTIEDAAELQLDQRHVIRLESRPKNIEGEGEITIRDLVRNALRMRPDRIIVGEVRGAEALDMLQAMNTGHEGSLSTVHANSPRDALNRLETMVLMAGYELPLRAIRSHVSSALELVIQLDRLDDGSRRVVEISEVQRMEGEVITLQELFEFKIEHFDSERRIVGRLHPTGLRPGFLAKFERHGIELPLSLFGGAGNAVFGANGQALQDRVNGSDR
jgi:pilus assembly protein CpaF